MTSKTSGLFVLACCAALIANQAFGQNASGIPRLQKQGSATQLIADGKPFLALAGELANSATRFPPERRIWRSGQGPASIAGRCFKFAVGIYASPFCCSPRR